MNTLFPVPEQVGGGQPDELEEEDELLEEELDELEAKTQYAAPSLKVFPDWHPIKIIPLSVKHFGIPDELHAM